MKMRLVNDDNTSEDVYVESYESNKSIHIWSVKQPHGKTKKKIIDPEIIFSDSWVCITGYVELPDTNTMGQKQYLMEKVHLKK